MKNKKIICLGLIGIYFNVLTVQGADDIDTKSECADVTFAYLRKLQRDLKGEDFNQISLTEETRDKIKTFSRVLMSYGKLKETAQLDTGKSVDYYLYGIRVLRLLTTTSEKRIKYGLKTLKYLRKAEKLFSLDEIHRSGYFFYLPGHLPFDGVTPPNKIEGTLRYYAENDIYSTLFDIFKSALASDESLTYERFSNKYLEAFAVIEHNYGYLLKRRILEFLNKNEE